MVKIGDKVRFLSDVGGGIVCGFQKGNIVLVEDEDGFEIPVLASECVVIETNELNIEKKKAPSVTFGKTADSTKESDSYTYKSTSQISSLPSASKETDWEDREVTFRPKPQERKDGDKLNVCLAFVPSNIKELSRTKFEAYIVNDCNYFVSYTYMTAENAVWSLRSSGVIEPNTKVFIEEFEHKDLNAMERVAIQLIAYKEDKPFALKPAIGTDMRIDVTKFYKLHTFRESMFFDEPALEYYVVKDDVPTRPLVISAEEVKKAMYDKREEDERRKKSDARKQGNKPDTKSIIEIDLHAHEILETTAGLSPNDIKEYQLGVFRKTMDEHIKEKGRKIVFIHGKGEGVLRSAIISELKHKYKSCTHQDASFQQYGFGATMVIIH